MDRPGDIAHDFFNLSCRLRLCASTIGINADRLTNTIIVLYNTHCVSRCSVLRLPLCGEPIPLATA